MTNRAQVGLQIIFGRVCLVERKVKYSFFFNFNFNLNIYEKNVFLFFNAC